MPRPLRTSSVTKSSNAVISKASLAISSVRCAGMTMTPSASPRMTSHSDISGDFNSAYTIKGTSHREGGPAGVPRDSTTTIEAKWLGACKPDQKPGDIVMPGGFKLNIKDADKLKGLLPK